MPDGQVEPSVSLKGTFDNTEYSVVQSAVS